MGYLRISLTRAQRTRPELAPVPSRAAYRRGVGHDRVVTRTNSVAKASGEHSPSSQLPATSSYRVSQDFAQPHLRERPPQEAKISLDSRSTTAPGETLPRSTTILPPTPTNLTFAPFAHANTVPRPFGAEPKNVTVDLRDQRASSSPRNDPSPALTTVERPGSEEFPEGAVEPAAIPNSLPSSIVKTPDFHVTWPEGNRAIPLPARERVEREVVRAAYSEFRRRTEQHGVPQSSVTIRVEHLTVKIHNPAPPAPIPVPNQPASVASNSALSDSFLRRSISHL